MSAPIRRRRDVMRALLAEFALTGASAAIIAAIIGTACAALLVASYMRFDFVVLGGTLAGTIGGAAVAVALIGLAGTWRALGQKAAPLLRNA